MKTFSLLLTILLAFLVTAIGGEKRNPPAGLPSESAEEEAHPVDQLNPKHWYRAPDSQMKKVAFKWPAGVKHGWGVKAVMSAWSSGVYDTKRDRLVIFGGGHSDYAGNEVYVFDVKQLKWKRLTDPTLDTDPEAKLERTGVYSDGNPRSCHTFDYIEYVPSIDRLCLFSVGSGWPMSWNVNAKHRFGWAFDFETKKWEKKSRVPWRPQASALDPVTGRAWLRSHYSAGYRLAEWDPVKDVWTVRSMSGGPAGCGVVDPVGRKFLAVGGKRFFAYDITAEGKLSQVEIKWTGLESAGKGPAVEYDPVLDKMICWKGGADVFTLDLTKMAWEKVQPAKSNAVRPGAPAATGTYGRWRYIPSKNAYVLVNAVNQDVFFYRLTRREQQPFPKRFVAALKKKDAALVKWVAGQVKLWPKAKAEPVLKAALSAQSGEAAAALEKALEEIK